MLLQNLKLVDSVSSLYRKSKKAIRSSRLFGKAKSGKNESEGPKIEDNGMLPISSRIKKCACELHPSKMEKCYDTIQYGEAYKNREVIVTDGTSIWVHAFPLCKISQAGFIFLA